MDYGKTAKKLLSLLAALAFMLTLVPSAAYAQSPDHSSPKYRPAVSSVGDIAWVKGNTDTPEISVSLTECCPGQTAVLRAEISGLEEVVSGSVGADGTVSVSFDLSKETLNGLADGDHPIRVSMDESEYHYAVPKTTIGTLKVSAPAESPADEKNGQSTSPRAAEQSGIKGKNSGQRRTTSVPAYDTNDIAVINDLIKNHGLDWTQVNPDGSEEPKDWAGVSWTNSGTPNRIKDLTVSDSSAFSNTVDIKKFGRLTSLESLDLSDTGVSGQLSGLKDLTSLYSLDLGNTEVSGQLSGLKDLTMLGYLSLSDTGVSGQLSDLKDLTMLGYLSLSYTGVSGQLSGLKDLTMLGSLYLDNTEVSGQLSDLKDLTSLYSLDLGNTGVSGQLSDLKDLTSLGYLSLSYTGVSGQLSGLKDLTRLGSLYLDNTEVSGQLSDLKDLTSLSLLSLSDTGVSGQLSDLKDLTSLSLLSLSDTGVSGQLSNLKDLTSLSLLSLSDTGVSGQLSDLKDLTSLYSLDLGNTGVSGQLSDLKDLTRLGYLSLSDTGVSGQLSDLKDLTSLGSLDLGNTGVSGQLSDLKNMSILFALNLKATGVNGELSGLKDLTSLSLLSLSDTGVSGQLSGLKDLTRLGSLDLGNTGVSGQLSDLKNMSILFALNLKATGVNGELSGLKDLTSLSFLDLSSTGISGDVSELDALTDLREADLSNLSITLQPVSFSGSPIAVEIPVKENGAALPPLSLAGGSFDHVSGKVKWNVPKTENGSLTYTFRRQVKVGCLSNVVYSGTVIQPYTGGGETKTPAVSTGTKGTGTALQKPKAEHTKKVRTDRTAKAGDTMLLEGGFVLLVLSGAGILAALRRRKSR